VLRRKLPLSLSPRILSLLVFFAVVGLHQYSFYLRESTWAQHPYLLPFLAKSWAQADGVLSGRLMFESFLNSSLMGMLGLIFFGIIHPTWRPQILKALQRSSSNGVPLIAASACVGIIIGIVEATSIANDFSSLIKTVVESSLFLALVGIMVGSIILGMGVPSVVCYLLMATLMGAFQIEHSFPAVEAPNYLQQLNPEIYRQECERVQERFSDAVSMAEQMFFDQLTGLVDHLVERMSGTEDGKPKTFRDSTIGNLQDFFERFRQLNIGSNSELEELVERAESIVEGVDPQQLRNNQNLRQHVATQMSTVHANLDGLLVDRPRRNIIRSNQRSESE